MKTTNFNMDLMVPNQTNKDVVFNESLLTIDNFLSITVNGFTKNPPETLQEGEKYIITDGEYKNHICFKTHESKDVSYFLPKTGTLFFILENHNFMLFENNNWEEIKFSSTNDDALNAFSHMYVPEKFTCIDGYFEVPNNTPYLHLYLHNDAELDFSKVEMLETTIVIKQCYNDIKELTWPHNILWENKSPHELTKIPNASDIVKLYRLPETTHFLGIIITQNFQF